MIRRGKEGGAFVRDVDHETVTRSLSLMLRLGKTTHRELTDHRSTGPEYSSGWELFFGRMLPYIGNAF